MRVDRMQIAVDLEGDVLRGLHHVLDGAGLRFTREVVAALGAAHRVHQAGAPQAEEDLLDVVVGETFLLGELARRHRPLPRPLGEVQRNDQTIFGPGGDAHEKKYTAGAPHNPTPPRAVRGGRGARNRCYHRFTAPTAPYRLLPPLTAPVSDSGSPPPGCRTRSPPTCAAATAGGR